MFPDIIPDPAWWRIAALVGVLSATLVLCAGITAMIVRDRLPSFMPAGWAYTPIAEIIEYADAPTQVFTVVQPLDHGPSALPHDVTGDCDDCDHSHCPAGLDHAWCLPECLTTSTVTVVPAPEPEHTGRHYHDTVEIVPPGWTPADDPEPGLVRPYLDDATIEIGAVR